MGQQHGQQASHLIQKYLAFIAADEATREQRVRDALTYVGAINLLNPHYIEEVRGLAQGARISFGEAMLCQTRGGGPVTPPAGDEQDGCTAFAFTGAATSHGQPLAGQNQVTYDACGINRPF